MVFIAVQVLLAQQRWPGRPQGSQVTLVHTLLAAQVLLAQQRWPGCPQGSQVSRTHMAPSAQRTSVRQQRCPGCPHPGTQVRLMHTLLGAQVLSGGQHGWLGTPH
jgi:hypothetical protein